jgi:hypothetical protein
MQLSHALLLIGHFEQGTSNSRKFSQCEAFPGALRPLLLHSHRVLFCSRQTTRLHRPTGIDQFISMHTATRARTLFAHAGAPKQGSAGVCGSSSSVWNEALRSKVGAAVTMGQGLLLRLRLSEMDAGALQDASIVLLSGIC